MKKRIICPAVLSVIMIFSNYSYSLCVSVSEANLRSGPGAKHEKTWEVFKYMPFERLETKGSWYRVRDVDGDVHWIFKKLVTDKFECAVVKVDKANIRNGPGTDNSESALSPALKYDSFRVMKRQSSWVKVKDEFGDTGWIFKKLLWIN